MLINSLKLKTFAVCHAHMGGCVDQKNRILCTDLIQNFSVRVTPLLQKIVIVIAACQPCAFWKILLIFEVFHCIYNVLKAFAGGKVALSHCICHAHKMREDLRLHSFPGSGIPPAAAGSGTAGYPAESAGKRVSLSLIHI